MLSKASADAGHWPHLYGTGTVLNTFKNRHSKGTVPPYRCIPSVALCLFGTLLLSLTILHYITDVRRLRLCLAIPRPLDTAVEAF
jgi:hypothetical protein